MHCECSVTGVSLSVDSGLGASMSIFFEWHYIPEWHSECNTILIGNPVEQQFNQSSHTDKYEQSECIQKLPAHASATVHSAI